MSPDLSTTKYILHTLLFSSGSTLVSAGAPPFGPLYYLVLFPYSVLSTSRVSLDTSFLLDLEIHSFSCLGLFTKWSIHCGHTIAHPV